MRKTKIVPANEVPGSIKQVGITMKYALLDYIRSRRFYVLLIISVLISAILTLVVGYYRPAALLTDVLTFYSSWWGRISIYVVALSGIFFGGDAISGEFQNKTGYFAVPNPIRRSAIYVGKWLSALIASTVILIVFAAIAMVNGIYYFSEVPYQFGESLLFAWFYLVAVLGTSFFFSSLFKSSSMSILVTAILFLFAFGLIADFASFAQIEPWFIITYGAGIIVNILSSSYPSQTQTSVVHLTGGRTFTSTSYYATVPEGLIIIGVYFIVTVVLGLLLFERKDFT